MAMVIADNHPTANANSTGSVSNDNTSGISMVSIVLLIVMVDRDIVQGENGR